MSGFARRLQTLLAPSIFLLLAAVCAIGIAPADIGCHDCISSEAKESKEVSEFDDVDLPFAIVDAQVTLMLGHSFDAWLRIEHDSALLSHSWNRCCRGPPKA